MRNDDDSLLPRILVEFVLVQEPGLASSISHENTALFGALDKALVVAANAIADSDESKILGVKYIAVFSSKLQQTLRQTVVVLFLLKGVVECGMTKVLLAVDDEELLELSKLDNERRVENEASYIFIERNMQ